jgi:hypothetical protein
VKAGVEMDALVADKVMHLVLKFPSQVRRYSTKIAAAWEVWEKLPWPKRLCDDDYDGLADPEYRRYTVMCGGLSYGPDTDYRPKFTASASTAPEAICRAALAAVGVELEQEAAG